MSRRSAALSSLLPVAVLVAMALLGTGTVFATDAQVTYLDDLKPLLSEHCTTCHRPAGLNLGGMVAPMPFTTYTEVRPLGSGDGAHGRVERDAAVARITRTSWTVPQRPLAD